MVDAFQAPRRLAAYRSRAGAILAGLAAVVVVSHGVMGYYAWSFYDAGTKIFVGEPDADATPRPSDEPSSDPVYEATPIATPATAQSRVTILLTGVDSGPNRSHALTDTMIVLTVDPKTGDTTMVSFPRDIAQFPLWDGRTFNGKINSLMSYAGRHPDEFPDGPLPTLIKELGYLLGTPIHYYAAIDLLGFEAMIDTVGGVTVNVERAINDFRYDWMDGSPRGFFLSKGSHTLDGRTALAYVRSRYGVGDNDFTRAARQQQLLIALRAKLTDPTMLPLIPEILGQAGDTIRTNFPPERVDEMLDLARGVDDGAITRYVLQPPTYAVHPPTNSTGGTYILRLDMKAVASLSVELFGAESRYYFPEAP